MKSFLQRTEKTANVLAFWGGITYSESNPVQRSLSVLEDRLPTQTILRKVIIQV